MAVSAFRRPPIPVAPNWYRATAPPCRRAAAPCAPALFLAAVAGERVEDEHGHPDVGHGPDRVVGQPRRRAQPGERGGDEAGPATEWRANEQRQARGDEDDADDQPDPR